MGHVESCQCAFRTLLPPHICISSSQSLWVFEALIVCKGFTRRKKKRERQRHFGNQLIVQLRVAENAEIVSARINDSYCIRSADIIVLSIRGPNVAGTA